MDDPSLTSLRKDFLLDPDIIFLNHGSFGATPRPVFESYQKWQLELERQPVEFLGRRAPDLLHQSRSILANYLSTDTNNLVYVTNATTGLNIVARSLHLGPGDEVLSSDHEYGALDRTWRFLAKQNGYKYNNLPISVPVTTVCNFVETFWQGVTPKTHVIFLSHITSPTALTFPVKEICQRAKDAGIITIIDGAHAPGQIPLDLDDLGADFYSGNLHKWLCAPKGAAFLYAAPHVQHLLEPLIVSWGWESDAPGPSRFVDYQEWAGTRDISAFLAVPDAIWYQQQHHWVDLRASCHALAVEAARRIQSVTGLPPLHSDSSQWFTQMVAMPLPAHVDLQYLKNALYDKYRVEIPLIDWNGQKLIRVSIQVYNTLDEVAELESALKNLL
jgi:isopenicillin-N epimerase